MSPCLFFSFSFSPSYNSFFSFLSFFLSFFFPSYFLLVKKAYAGLALTIFNFYLWSLGLCPADSFDEATADMISDGVVDLFQQLIKTYYEKDETKKVMRKLMSVSVSHIQSLSGFTPEIANQSVFFFSLFLQSASRDIREFEQRRF